MPSNSTAGDSSNGGPPGVSDPVAHRLWWRRYERQVWQRQRDSCVLTTFGAALPFTIAWFLLCPLLHNRKVWRWRDDVTGELSEPATLRQACHARRAQERATRRRTMLVRAHLLQQRHAPGDPMYASAVLAEHALLKQGVTLPDGADELTETGAETAGAC